MHATVEDPQVVKPAAAVALSAAKENDVVSERTAHVAVAVLPRTIRKRRAVGGFVAPLPVVQLLVLQEQRESLIERDRPAGVSLHRCKALALEFACPFLRHFAGTDALHQFRVGLDLRDTNRGVGSGRRGVVVLVILERLTEWRCAVEARDTVASERVDVFAAGDAQ